MTTKQRAYLKSLAMTMDPIFQIQNCADDPRELAELVAERTRSQVVQVIGKKIVLYKEGKDDKKKIVWPSSSSKKA